MGLKTRIGNDTSGDCVMDRTAVTSDLRRASNSLGPLSEAAKREFAEFLASNELELAHDVLMRSGTSTAAPAFWQHLARAGERMGIARAYSTAHFPAVWVGRFQAIIRRTKPSWVCWRLRGVLTSMEPDSNRRPAVYKSGS